MGLQDCLGVQLRREDSLECRRLGLRDDGEALRVSLRESTVAYVWRVDGQPAAFAGLHVGPRGEGVPWCLTTDEARRHPAALHRMALRFLWGQPCDVLRQQVDAAYASALRWVARLGFNVSPAAPFGPLGALFCAVEWRREWTR
jgi:hypothetical protein